ncbi:MAG: hydantoinase/oxoprolinase family protein [Nitrospinota bacterium]
MGILALDIGGAFIKSTYLPVTGRQKYSIIPFHLYEQPKKLVSILKSIRRERGKQEVAVTMTGELCDCFKSRRDGVRHIAKTAESVFGRNVKIFSRKGRLVSVKQAVRKWEETASANWAITPLWLGGFADDFLVMDIGSTTTDITPVRKKVIANKGWNDFERSVNGELVYTGYLRTTTAAVAQSVTLRGRKVPLSSENFCNMGDVHLIRGAITKAKYNTKAPDGGGSTRTAAMKRLARQLMAERSEFSVRELEIVADRLADAQLSKIVKAARRFRLKVVPIGSGSFIVGEALRTGKLKPHPLARMDGVNRLGPTLSLAYLMRDKLL